MTISVFTDFRFTSYSKQTGVGKHIFQMVNGLSQISDNHVSLLVAQDQSSHHRSGSLSALPALELPLRWKMAEALWTVAGHPIADRWVGSPDWIYCPKNDFIPIRKGRVAVTVHGAHELDPKFPQPRTLSARLNRTRRRVSYSRMLQQADLVLTVSKFLKNQMMDWFRVPEGKFCVVGNGVEREFFQVAEQKRGVSGEPVERPFVLAVGGLNYLDGGDRIIRVASHLQQRVPGLRVLVAGCDHEEAMKRAASELPNTTLLGYVPSDRLAHYMRDALALLYPTRYETFGIAAAEAMAAGTPVVTCRSTAVPEVVGEAGIYIDPDQPESVVEVLMDLQSQSGLRDSLIVRGHQRAKEFTWSACIARLQHALENI